MKKLVSPFALLTLIFTFLVIIAGSVVRVSQSGMGCPDWPKCFGYYIPPTDPDQVNFHPRQHYQKGMMVIVNDTLWRARQDFVSTEIFDRSHWEKYPKHNYSKFIVYQTWVEYINRLMGALLGLFVLVTMVSSLAYWRSDWQVPVFSFVLLFLTGFQAWLGKLVVDGNLIPQSISIHMLASLLLLMATQWVLHRVRSTAEVSGAKPWLRWMVLAAVVFTVIQILIGTQVREEIDVIAHELGYDQRAGWIEKLSSVFTLHQAFSMMLLALNLFIVFELSKGSDPKTFSMAKVIGLILGLELIFGLILRFVNMPQPAQTGHLLLSCLLFSAQVALFFRLGRNTVISSAGSK